MNIFICTPIDLKNLKSSKKRAEALAEKVRAKHPDFHPITPFDFGDEKTYKYTIGYTLSALKASDAVLLADDWNDTLDCKILKGAAEIYNKVIMTVDAWERSTLKPSDLL